MSAPVKRKKKEPKIYKVRVGRASAGLGLFAEEDIPKGAIIIEYTGRVISEGEAYTSRSKYLFEITKSKTIDGSARSNTARYVNHSCRPNCDTKIRKGRIFIVARRAIKKGEELAYDYGKEYFDDRIRPHGCRCPKCAPAQKKS